jgi:hypothetical protein
MKGRGEKRVFTSTIKGWHFLQSAQRDFLSETVQHAVTKEPLSHVLPIREMPDLKVHVKETLSELRHP